MSSTGTINTVYLHKARYHSPPPPVIRSASPASFIIQDFEIQAKIRETQQNPGAATELEKIIMKAEMKNKSGKLPKPNRGDSAEFWSDTETNIQGVKSSRYLKKPWKHMGSISLLRKSTFQETRAPHFIEESRNNSKMCLFQSIQQPRGCEDEIFSSQETVLVRKPSIKVYPVRFFDQTSESSDTSELQDKMPEKPVKISAEMKRKLYIAKKGQTMEIKKFSRTLEKFDYKVSKSIDPTQYLMDKTIKGVKVLHAIDPHKDMGFQDPPISNTSIRIGKKNLIPEQHILEGNEIIIFVEQIEVLKKCSKKEIQYKLYGKTEYEEKITMLCFMDKKTQKVKKYDTQDICGHIFGGTSSRFWFAKNIINLQPRDRDLPAGMLSWNMITIIIKGLHIKNLNLIIPNEKEMDVLLQFLVEKNYENDQKRNLNQIEIIKDQCLLNKQLTFLKKKEKPNFSKAMTLIKIMRIRMKVSYYAWKKLITVKELLLNQIMDTYIYFNTHKFEPLNLDTLLGDNFSPKNILNTYISKKTRGKFQYIADKKKLKRQNSHQVAPRRLESIEDKFTDIVLQSIQRKNNMRFALYKDQTIRLTRIGVLLALKFLFRLEMITQIDTLQLLIYKEQLVRKQFCNVMKFEHKQYFQLPQELTQEWYPLSFQFYNCMIPLLEMINTECYHTYLSDCDKYMQIQQYRDYAARKLKSQFAQRLSITTKEPQKTLSSQETLSQKYIEDPGLMEKFQGYGSIHNSFFSTSTFRFIEKPYGMPRAYKLDQNSLPNKDFKVLLERQIMELREQELNDKLILLTKFTNIKQKGAMIASEIQQMKPPAKRMGLQIPADEFFENPDLTQLTVQEIEAAQTYLIAKAKKYDMLIRQKNKEKNKEIFMKKYNTQFRYDRKTDLVDKNLKKAMNLTDKKLNIHDFIRKTLFKKGPPKEKISKPQALCNQKHGTDNSFSCHSFESQQSLSD